MTKQYYEQLSKCVAESIGTFALVFAGTGSIMVAERFPDQMSQEAIPFVFGLVIATMIYAVGHISGAHFNPAVTIAFVATRHFPWKQMLFYWLSQIFGALLASFLLYMLLPVGTNYGETLPHIPYLQAFIWEVILTFFLMFVIISVATDTRAVGNMAGIAIGGTITFCSFLGGPLTGASMNPARSIAPAVVSGNTTALWLYIIAPIIGAICAAFIYTWIRCHQEDETSNQKTTFNLTDGKEKAKGCC